MKDLEHTDSKNRKELEKKDRRSRILVIEHNELEKTSKESIEKLNQKVAELSEQMSSVTEELTTTKDKQEEITLDNEKMKD